MRHRFYALVGLLSLRQFPVHWERNENSMQFRKAIVWVDTVAGRIGVRPIVLRKQRLAKLKGEPPPSVPFVSASARIPKSEALSVKEIGGAHCIAGFRSGVCPLWVIRDQGGQGHTTAFVRFAQQQPTRCNALCAGCSCGRAKPVAPVCRGRRWLGHSRSHAAACADVSELHLGPSPDLTE